MQTTTKTGPGRRGDLTGRVALVTGGGRGIGAAVAVRLAEAGADVALTYQTNAERAQAVARAVTAAGSRALPIRADSANAAAVTAAVDRTAEELGRLDILVNNAGAFLIGPVEELGPAELEQTLAVNVRAPYLASRAAVRHMTEGGRIISIGSNVADRTVFPGFSLYAMSKAALMGMTRGLARELGPRGIAVTVVHPGATDTDLNPADGPNGDAITSHVPLGRFADPTEIAATVLHLAGDAGRYITGTSVTVDGGFTV